MNGLRAKALRLATGLAIFLLVASCATPAQAQRELRIKTLPETPLTFVTTVTSPLTRGRGLSGFLRSENFATICFSIAA